jgi:lipopolysaccharide biosynthesis glycosyltransferase
MAENVIVLAGDANYVPHMKATAVNCRAHGGWTGDICFVLGADAHHMQEDLESRGIHTVLSDRTHYWTKLALFRPYFRRWRKAFYTDPDVLVQRPLAPLFDLPFNTALMMDGEPFTFKHSFSHWDDGAALRSNPTLTNWLWSVRDPTAYSFCTANILWKPNELAIDTEEQLTALETRLRPINTHCRVGTEQSIVNVLLYDQITPVPDKWFCYFGVNRDGAPPTVLVHYVGAFAPWRVGKTPWAFAYANPVIGEPCIFTYHKLLANFETIFPKGS